MNILYVSRSHFGRPNTFVIEQASSVGKYHDVKVEHYFIEDGIISGYGKTLFKLPKIVKLKGIDVVHVHNGLSAFVVILSKILLYKSMKVVITFHGSDLNEKTKRKYSLIASRWSSHNILVSERMSRFLKSDYSIIPCGIDTDVKLIHRDHTRREKGWNNNDFIILFSSSFQRKEKDPKFAFKVVETFSKYSHRNVIFVELKGYNREQLTQLMQAADVLILCSTMEGSPQVVKEAILNSLPVVSNDVGDVAEICAGVDNCFIVTKDVSAFVDRLDYLSKSNKRIENRNPVIEKYDNKIISDQLAQIYRENKS